MLEERKPNISYNYQYFSDNHQALNIIFGKLLF